MAGVLLAASPAPAQTCPTEGTEAVQIAAVDEGLDLLLSDGRVAALAGLDPQPEAAGYRDFTGRLAGAEIRLALLDTKPDRWGRLAAAAFTSPDGRNLAESLLADGLARYRPDQASRPCRAALLAAEKPAREARRGLWAHPGALLDGGDAKAVLAAPKGFVVVEGRVLSIGEQRGRLYLNFGARRTTDFTIVISKRNLALFDAAQVPLRALAGRRLRVRGLLDRGFGPTMEVASPDALELLDGLGGATEKR